MSGLKRATHNGRWTHIPDQSRLTSFYVPAEVAKPEGKDNAQLPDEDSAGRPDDAVSINDETLLAGCPAGASTMTSTTSQTPPSVASTWKRKVKGNSSPDNAGDDNDDARDVLYSEC